MEQNNDLSIPLPGPVQCIVSTPPKWTPRQTPQDYANDMAEAFREPLRALRDTGTLWLTLHDEYFPKELPRSPKTVRLNRAERDMVMMIANARNKPKQQSGVRSQRLSSDYTDLDIHVMGVAAEVAAAKFFGVLPCFYLSLSGDTDTPDLVINGKRCEVKCRRKAGYDFLLLGSDPDSFDADIGILIYDREHEPWTYTIHGVIDKERLRQVGEIRNYRHGDKWAVDPKHFADALTLLYAWGDLLGVPWRVALSLQAAGWRLRHGQRFNAFPLRYGQQFTAAPKAPGYMTSFFLAKTDRPEYDAMLLLMDLSCRKTCIKAGSLEGDTVYDPFDNDGLIREAAALGRRGVA